MSRQIVCIFALYGFLLASAAVAETSPDVLPSLKWDKQHAGTELDLSRYRLTLHDDFDQQTLTDERGKGPWLAPVHSPYGEATFDKPSPDNQTYTIADGMLTIRASKAADGKWHAGSVQSVDHDGKGFAQRYGYFEAKMKFPNMPGAWCAFWLKSQSEHWDKSVIRAEIDVVEWYGGDIRGHHRTVHLRPASNTIYRTEGRLQETWYLSNYSRHDGLAGNWHTYGVSVTPELITVYLDRKEVARFPTLEEFEVPLYPLLSMTLHNVDLARATSPFEMNVDYVEIYSYPVPGAPPTFAVH